MSRSLRIYKNRYIQYLIWLVLFFVCFSGILIDILKFPRTIRYIPDLFIVLLVIDFLNKNSRYIKIKGKDSAITNFVIFFIISSFLLWLFNIGSPLLLIWGARNTFRFLLYFICVIHSFSVYDTKKMLDFVNPLLIINFVLCLFEYFILGYSGDYVGGAFGVTSGCNAALNVLIVVATIHNAINFMKRRNSLLKSMMYITLCACISGMAELKVYIVEVLIIVCIIGVFSKGITKKIILILAGIIFALLSIQFIETLIPGWEGFFTFEIMYNMASSTDGYTNSGDLNRLTAISELNKKFFADKINLIGYGLGNCEYSDSFAFLNSEFFKEYGELHYAWFSVAKIYLELGWLGVVSHIFIWVYTLYVSIRKVTNTQIKLLITVVSVFSVFFFFYNFTMNLDIAYVIYAFLAIPYIWLKDQRTKELL